MGGAIWGIPVGLLWLAVALADITGKPRVIDGDTLEIAGERVRLHGIDAPESGQEPSALCGLAALGTVGVDLTVIWKMSVKA